MMQPEAEMADSQGKAARVWWKKKRWWALGGFAVWAAYLSVPYSMNGPSLSCLQVLSIVDRRGDILSRLSDANFQFDKINDFFLRSGYEYRGILNDPKEVMYLLPLGTYSCLPLSILRVDSSYIRVIIDKDANPRIVTRIETDGADGVYTLDHGKK